MALYIKSDYYYYYFYIIIIHRLTVKNLNKKWKLKNIIKYGNVTCS